MGFGFPRSNQTIGKFPSGMFIVSVWIKSLIKRSCVSIGWADWHGICAGNMIYSSASKWSFIGFAVWVNKAKYVLCKSGGIERVFFLCFRYRGWLVRRVCCLLFVWGREVHLGHTGDRRRNVLASERCTYWCSLLIKWQKEREIHSVLDIYWDFIQISFSSVHFEVW